MSYFVERLSHVGEYCQTKFLFFECFSNDIGYMVNLVDGSMLVPETKLMFRDQAFGVYDRFQTLQQQLFEQFRYHWSRDIDPYDVTFWDHRDWVTFHDWNVLQTENSVDVCYHCNCFSREFFQGIAALLISPGVIILILVRSTFVSLHKQSGLLDSFRLECLLPVANGSFGFVVVAVC